MVFAIDNDASRGSGKTPNVNKISLPKWQRDDCWDNLYRISLIESIMTNTPRSIPTNTLAIKALEIMEEHSITSLFVHNHNNPDDKNSANNLDDNDDSSDRDNMEDNDINDMMVVMVIVTLIQRWNLVLATEPTAHTYMENVK